MHHRIVVNGWSAVLGGMVCLGQIVTSLTANAQTTQPKRVQLAVEVVESLETHPDVVYARYGDRQLRLDLYRPRKSSEKLPAILCIHGGGWFQGDRSAMRPLAQALAARGYVTITISYRLSGEAKFPAAIQDCKAAVRWLRSEAEGFGVDARAIGVTGLSAGGHLAALLATSGGVASLEGDGGHPEYSSSVQACMAMGAQSDLQSERIRGLSQAAEDRFYRSFLGGNAVDLPQVYALASPRYHLDAKDPPLAFMTGERDDLSTRAEAIRQDLRHLGISTGLTVLPDAPHAFLNQPAAFDQCVMECDHFFATHLKNFQPKSP